MKSLLLIILISLNLLFLNGCIPPPPENTNNVCNIFRQYPEWFWSVEKIEKHKHIDISVLMAIIYQESRFNGGAKPPREYILWVIPWFRPTTAYGYSQAINETWRRYCRDTGHSGADRDSFEDATDFIAWYTNQIKKYLEIPSNDAYNLYLAYHEGIGGYRRGTYTRKQWLIRVANKVARRASIYRAQLARCRSSLPQKPWWRFW